jgi:hypothetical protein
MEKMYKISSDKLAQMLKLESIDIKKYAKALEMKASKKFGFYECSLIEAYYKGVNDGKLATQTYKISASRLNEMLELKSVTIGYLVERTKIPASDEFSLYECGLIESCYNVFIGEQATLAGATDIINMFQRADTNNRKARFSS